MSARILEIASNNKHLSTFRGFLKVSEKGKETARVPLNDINSLIISGHGTTFTNELVVRLAERNIVLISCGSNHQPAAWLSAFNSNSVEAQRLDLQIALKKTQKKQIWASIVRNKLRAQSQLLQALGKPNAGLVRLSKEVKSGDIDNCEAQAARVYWKTLFGKQFRRDRDLAGVNAGLNYGYTILRSAVARAITGAGLHPNIPLHHRNKYSSFRLVDDFVEVFRPVVDAVVYSQTQPEEYTELTAHKKQVLAALIDHQVSISGKRQTIGNATKHIAASFIEVCGGDSPRVALPDSLRVDGLLSS